MRLAMWWCGFIALTLGLGLGCKEDEQAPRAPATGSGVTTHPSPRGGGDHTDDGADEDAGGPAGDGGRSISLDGGGSILGVECAETEPTTFMGEDPEIEPLASTTAPADFLVTRVLAAWDSDCEHPAFRIELSDGECPNGSGHTLVFWFDAGAITRDEVHLGLNQIVPESESDAITVRYQRPSRLDPSGEWGTCAAAVGTLQLRGDPPATSGGSAKWSGNFTLDLTSCGTSLSGRQQVVGTFNTVMRRSLAQVCGSDAGT